MAMTAAVERRAAPRASLHGTVTVLLDQQRLQVDAVDISPTGIAVRLPRCPEVGTYLRLEFDLQGGFGRRAPLHADGVVCRAQPSPRGCLLGVEFRVIEGPVVEAICAYVRSANDPGVPEPVVRARSGPTGEYAPAERYPPPGEQTLESVRGTPGMPGGPAAAPSTGEYLPPDEDGSGIPAPPAWGELFEDEG